jgi:hypothetical protein
VRWGEKARPVSEHKNACRSARAERPGRNARTPRGGAALAIVEDLEPHGAVARDLLAGVRAANICEFCIAFQVSSGNSALAIGISITSVFCI